MKKLIISTFLAAFAVAAVAQEMPKGYQKEVNATYERVYERGPYLTNRFFDNIFVGVGGGVNMFFGEADGEASKFYSGRLAPALDISLGKWITPSVGIRMQYSGLSTKGWYNAEGGDFQEGVLRSDNLIQRKFDIMNIHADLLWNASNAISGFKDTRFWDFVPFVGFGYAKASNDDFSKEAFAFNAGLLNVLRISNAIDLTLEGRYMFVQPSFERAHFSTADFNGMASLTAGLQFNFGPKGGFKRATAYVPADYTPYNQRINSLERELGDAKSSINQLNKELAAEKNKPAVVAAAKDIPVSMQVFFRIGSAVVAEKDMLNLERVAKSIKADTDKQYSVIGFADSATGSSRLNTTLARQRAEAVVKVLTERFGVSASQLSIDSKGGVKNHKNLELDRTVIVEK